MNMEDSKSRARVLLGAAFLMATSAIGPGFLTQTANFTYAHGANHGFIILSSVVLGVVVQLNVWRVICVSGMRGQDIANKTLPGLGYLLTFLICMGGLAFNIGNVGGAALGLNALADVPLVFGYIISGLLGIFIFLSANAKTLVDWIVKICAAIMIIIVFIVMFTTQPPVGEAAMRTVMPQPPVSATMTVFFFPIMTYLGGTVGGYITFSGAHRLLDAGIQGKENLQQINVSSIQGISVATIMRIILYLAIFGVVALGFTLAPLEGRIANPAATAFYHGAGIMGYRFFGIVLFFAGITSVIGAAYTSVSFLKTLFKPVMEYERYFICGFIAFSTLIMSFLGSPATLLVLVGFLNGLILPVSLTVMLVASRRVDIVGNDYKHPTVLIVLGAIVVVVTAYLSITAMPNVPGMVAALFGG